MSATPVTESEIQAYVDGRLSGERQAAVELWLASRPDDAARVAVYRRLGEELRATYAGVLDEPVPERLAQAFEARQRWTRAARAAAWLAAGVGLGTAMGWVLHEAPGSLAQATAESAMVHRAALAHAVYAPEVRHPVEAGPDEKAHLVGWLSKRLGTKVEAPDLQRAGMSLVGGRLLPGETRPTAFLMYQTAAGRRVTLHWAPDATRSPETDLRYAQEPNGVRVVYWLDRECGYAVASADFTEEELQRVAALAHDQLEK